MSFIEELKRRNVFKVGIAYLVGSWILIQVSDILFENIGTPAWVMQTMLVFLSIGFFIALFFAWAFEMTPEGIKREEDVDRTQSVTPQTGKKLNTAIFAMMALAIVYLLYDKFSGPAPIVLPSTETAGATQQEESIADETSEAVSRKSIAVLPFTNRSRNEEDEFFVDGIHDDLLTNLARIGELKVISRTSVLRYKNTDTPIPDIAKELGVATIMEGAVQRSGDTVRINVQLIDAQTDEHLWAEIFDREMTAENLFAIQSEISQKIANELKATLSPQEQQQVNVRPTENLAAYNSYLRGRQLMSRRNSIDLEQARVEFERAVELDPDFALAWASISELTRWLSSYSTLSVTEAMTIRERAGKKALELNPNLGEAYVALAGLDSYHERWEEAESKYLKAIELSPGYAPAYLWYSDFLARKPARRREALSMALEAAELDPLSSAIQERIARQHIRLGQYERAEQQLQRLIELDPEFSSSYQTMATLMSQTGRFDQQFLWLQKSIDLDPGNILLLSGQANALLDLRGFERLERIKQKITDVDDQHWSNAWVETLENFAEKNYAGALESGRSMQKQFAGWADFYEIYGWLHVLNGDFGSARKSFEIAYPEYFDRDKWTVALEQSPANGCLMPLILLRTGDESMARDLVETSTRYLEDELPLLVEHADNYFLMGCYMLDGEHEKALDELDITVAHGHLTQWWIWTDLPLFDPVRGTPRFEAALEQIRERMSAQRENLARIEAEAGP